MRTISRTNFPGTSEELHARVAAFKQAVEDHAFTEGVPAPREEDLIEALARSDEPFELEPAPTPDVPPSEEEIAAARKRALQAAVQRHLDETAQGLGYDSIFTAATYAEESSVPRFQTEGRALRSWRSRVWGACYEILQAVEAGTAACPTEESLIAALPSFTPP